MAYLRRPLPLLLALLALMAGSCAAPPEPTPQASQARPTADAGWPRLAHIDREPVVRVRIARADQLRFDDARLHAWHPSTPTNRHALPGPVTVRPRGESLLVVDGRGRRLRWPANTLMLEHPGGTTRLAQGTYPGTVAVHAIGGRVQAVNHVGIESYLPGVLSGELYANWDEQAFVAQAVAARSYAMAMLPRSRGRHYDLESTTASQVYQGQTRNPKAGAAVAQTRGLVLGHRGFVLPAYYSSTCGGVSQAAATVMHGAPDWTPLGSSDRGDDCSVSPHRHWRMLARPLDDAAARLRAWGRANSHEVAQLREFRNVDVVRRHPTGRPAHFYVIDGSTPYRLHAEQLRAALNYQPPALPALAPAALLKSSFAEPTIRDGMLMFSRGRGHGHGVGLCQWGAQNLATRGHEGLAIAKFYYPGAEIYRLY